MIQQKLRKVGANKVISPYLAGGHRAVQAVLRPTVLHFMEMATRPEFLDEAAVPALVAEQMHVYNAAVPLLAVHDDVPLYADAVIQVHLRFKVVRPRGGRAMKLANRKCTNTGVPARTRNCT